MATQAGGFRRSPRRVLKMYRFRNLVLAALLLSIGYCLGSSGASLRSLIAQEAEQKLDTGVSEQTGNAIREASRMELIRSWCCPEAETPAPISNRAGESIRLPSPRCMPAGRSRKCRRFWGATTRVGSRITTKSCGCTRSRDSRKNSSSKFKSSKWGCNSNRQFGLSRSFRNRQSRRNCLFAKRDFPRFFVQRSLQKRIQSRLDTIRRQRPVVLMFAIPKLLPARTLVESRRAGRRRT